MKLRQLIPALLWLVFSPITAWAVTDHADGWRDGCVSGSPEDCTYLGEAYQSGAAVVAGVVDPQAAARFFKDACDQGNGAGCSDLGAVYYAGQGIPLDQNRAAQYFFKACQLKNMAGCDNLSTALQTTTGDVAPLVALNEKACNEGSARNCNDLGALYGQGKRVTRDVLHSTALFRKACNLNSAFGCQNLAHSLKTQAQALPEIIAANHAKCDQGNGAACSDLGMGYYLSKGVAEDAARARILFEKSCMLGTAAGCSNLVTLLTETDQLPARADALEKGCALGITAHCSDLGIVYLTGRGRAKDAKKAITCWEIACDKNEAAACSNLGTAYEKGDGVAKDLPRATLLYQKACALGSRKNCK